MRSCLECALFSFREGHHRYSEVTPGEDPVLACDATPAHWIIDLMDATEQHVRQALLTAETCPDFRAEAGLS